MAAAVNNETHVETKQTPSIKQVASNTPEFGDHDEQLELALANYVPGTDLEKQLVRKVDWYMIPTLWGMCVLCFLNRNNIVSTLHFDHVDLPSALLPIDTSIWLTTTHAIGQCQRSRHERGSRPRLVSYVLPLFSGLFFKSRDTVADRNAYEQNTRC